MYSNYAGGAFVVGLIAYIACGRIARRTSQYGGGTVILSWIGFLIPCIAWIAVFQGYTALNRAVASAPSPEMVNNKKTFARWATVYVVAMIAAAYLGSRT